MLNLNFWHVLAELALTKIPSDVTVNIFLETLCLELDKFEF